MVGRQLGILVLALSPAVIAAGGAAVTVKSSEGVAVRIASGLLAVDGVYVNGKGPYSFLLDTGAESSAISPELAARLGLTPTYAVVHVSMAAESKAPAHMVREVSLGGAVAADLEMIELPMMTARKAARGVDGVLGQNFLGRIPWLLDLERGRLIFDPGRELKRGVGGPIMSAGEFYGRMVVRAVADGRVVGLVLDSGATHLVLFGGVQGSAPRTGRVETHTAAASATVGRVSRLCIGDAELTDLPAVRMASAQSGADGLLPVTLFGSIYCDAPRGVVMLAPRKAR